MKKIQAVIMAAGNSVRTYPLTITRPKPLLPILNQTILEHNISQLSEFVDEIIIIVNYKSEMIEVFSKKLSLKYKLKIVCVKQKEPLGTANAVGAAEKVINGKFIVLNGDDLFSKNDIRQCIKHEYCVLGKKVNDISCYGAIIQKNKFVLDLVEKPKTRVSDLANVGCYIFGKDIFKIIKTLKKSERNEYEITDAIKILSKQKKVYCEDVSDYWCPHSYAWNVLTSTSSILNNPDNLKHLKDDKNAKTNNLKKRSEENIENIENVENVSINEDKGPVIIGMGSIIKAGSYIEGPCLIGENCTIGPNSIIVQSSLGNSCLVGGNSQINNSVLFDNVSVGISSLINNSVIGYNVLIGSRVLTIDNDIDNINIRSKVKDSFVDSGMKKLGAIIGDFAHVGDNVVIHPGIKIWPYRKVSHNSILKEDLV